ncbi:mechanosensitive ion channel domain-containing protein [Halomicroarcula sp. GCM10025710]
MRAGSVWLFQTTPTPTQAGTTTDLGGLLPVQIPVWVMQLLTALFVLTVAFLISRLLVRLLGRRIAQRFRRPSLTRTALRSIRVGVFILALLTVMNIYGLELGDIALSVTVFSAVIGVILAPIVGSIISGMFLLADQPYEIGDMIEPGRPEPAGLRRGHHAQAHEDFHHGQHLPGDSERGDTPA